MPQLPYFSYCCYHWVSVAAHPQQMSLQVLTRTCTQETLNQGLTASTNCLLYQAKLKPHSYPRCWLTEPALQGHTLLDQDNPRTYMLCMVLHVTGMQLS